MSRCRNRRQDNEPDRNLIVCIHTGPTSELKGERNAGFIQDLSGRKTLCPHSESKREWNAGFIRQKVTLDPLLPDNRDAPDPSEAKARTGQRPQPGRCCRAGLPSPG